MVPPSVPANENLNFQQSMGHFPSVLCRLKTIDEQDTMFSFRKTISTPLRIAIFGRYKSGTTMLFYVIKDALPSKSRLLFEEQQYTFRRRDQYLPVLAKVILGESEDGHDVDYESFLAFEKRVYLIRDPRDWLVSGTLFLISQHVTQHSNQQTISSILKLLKQKEADSSSVALVTILEETLKCLPGKSLAQTLDGLNRAMAWQFAFEKKLGDHILVKYEDIIDNKYLALSDYLGLSMKGCRGVDAAHSHVPRTGSYGNWRDWLLPQDVELFQPIFDPFIRRYQYETSWEVNPVQNVQAEHCSQYVERTMRQSS